MLRRPFLGLALLAVPALLLSAYPQPGLQFHLDQVNVSVPDHTVTGVEEFVPGLQITQTYASRSRVMIRWEMSALTDTPGTSAQAFLWIDGAQADPNWFQVYSASVDVASTHACEMVTSLDPGTHTFEVTWGAFPLTSGATAQISNHDANLRVLAAG